MIRELLNNLVWWHYVLIFVGLFLIGFLLLREWNRGIGPIIATTLIAIAVVSIFGPIISLLLQRFVPDLYNEMELLTQSVEGLGSVLVWVTTKKISYTAFFKRWQT